MPTKKPETPKQEIAPGAIRDVTVTLKECECTRCEHRWIPKPELKDGKWVNEVPTACPVCKTPYWFKPRVQRRRTPEEIKKALLTRQKEIEAKAQAKVKNIQAQIKGLDK